VFGKKPRHSIIVFGEIRKGRYIGGRILLSTCEEELGMMVLRRSQALIYLEKVIEISNPYEIKI
jgi:hypothetical protein